MFSSLDGLTLLLLGCHFNGEISSFIQTDFWFEEIQEVDRCWLVILCSNFISACHRVSSSSLLTSNKAYLCHFEPNFRRVIANYSLGLTMVAFPLMIEYY